jgi:hypothetical protein
MELAPDSLPINRHRPYPIAEIAVKLDVNSRTIGANSTV